MGGERRILSLGGETHLPQCSARRVPSLLSEETLNEMSNRSILQFTAGLAIAVLASAGAHAVGSEATNQVAILHTSDVWSELAPCG